MKKAIGFYRKRDKNGKMAVHPITAPTRLKRPATPKVYHTIPARTVEFKLITAPVSELKSTSSRPLNEGIIQDYMDKIRNGRTINPILVHRTPSGELEIIEGHHRTEAFRRLGITEIPAVENSLADIIRKIGHGAVKVASATGRAAVRGAYYAGRTRGAVSEAKEAYRTGKESGLAGTQAQYRTEAEIRTEARRLEQLVKMAQSSNPFERRMAIAKIRKLYPDELESLQRDLSRPITTKPPKDWFQKGRGEMEGYGFQ